MDVRRSSIFSLVSFPDLTTFVGVGVTVIASGTALLAFLTFLVGLEGGGGVSVRFREVETC